MAPLAAPSIVRRGPWTRPWGSAMTTRPAKVVPFPDKRRHIRGRFTGTGEFLRLVLGGRAERKGGDDGPRAA